MNAPVSEIYRSMSMTLVDSLTEESSHGDGSVFDESDLLEPSDVGGVNANGSSPVQLSSAGSTIVTPASMSHKKRQRLHAFESNPSIRKRQQTRLLRKLCSLMEEYIARVGQQAVFVCCTPGAGKQSRQQSTHVYRVYGSQPLETIIRSHRTSIMSDLETHLSRETPPLSHAHSLFDMPPLAVDGLATSLDKMTQAQLRMFIPEMLRYSTGKSKPGWGKPSCRPIWWPDDVPWANVRSDARDDETKRNHSWTQALRRVVLNCYRHHGREDLLPPIHSPPPPPEQIERLDPDVDTANHHWSGGSTHTLMQAISNADGTMSLIELDAGGLDFIGGLGAPGGAGEGAAQYLRLADGTHARILHTLPGSVVKGQGGMMYLTQQQLEGGCAEGGQHILSQLMADDSQLVQLSNTADASLSMIALPASVYQSVISGFQHQSDSNSADDGYQIVSSDALIGHDDCHMTELVCESSSCDDNGGKAVVELMNGVEAS